MNPRFYFALLLLASLATAIRAQQTTWEKIQQEVLNRNCTGCHVEGSSFARQSGLVLTQDVAYNNLVGVTPHNSAAAADGLLRVSSAGGAPGLFQSFLWEKINVAEQDHFYNGHPNYGQLMPLGLPSLTNGELAFIKAWIFAGAPATGAVADPVLLNDTTRYQPPEFKVLAPPARGFQFHLGPFNVWPSQVHDREFLYFEPYPTTQDLYVSRYEISFRPGSHHFILYNYPAGKPTPQPRVYRDVRDAQGNVNRAVADQLNDLFPFFFFVGTQTPFANYHFPKGVALRLPPGSGFDLNSHSVNRSNATRIGEVYVNIHTVDRSEIEHVAEYTNIGNFDISLPPHQVTTLTKTFFFSEQRHIIQMWAHAHEHMIEFKIVGVGGKHHNELLYWTNDWQHPLLLELDPPLTMEAGEGLRMITTYNNTTNNWIFFGPLSSDEMQFLFYIYFTGELTSVAESKSSLPTAFVLEQNYPNPFSAKGHGAFGNPATEIRFALPQESHVVVKVFNIIGVEIRTLADEEREAGYHRVRWDGKDEHGNPVASGVYLYQLRAGSFSQVKKMSFIR